MSEPKTCRYCGKELKLEYEKTTGECIVCSNEITRSQIVNLANSIEDLIKNIGATTTPGGILMANQTEPTEVKVGKLEMNTKNLAAVTTALARYTSILSFQLTYVLHFLRTNFDDLSIIDEILEPMRQVILQRMEQDKQNAQADEALPENTKEEVEEPKED